MTDSKVAHPSSSPELGKDSLLLGIDGGGTNTVAWVAKQVQEGEPVVLGKGVAGSSNLRAVGLDPATKNLDRAIAAAQADAQIDKLQIASAVLALAGAGQPEAKRKIHDWAEARQLAPKLSVVHDADAVLGAGTPEGFGIALIAGTGSSCLGRDPQGNQEVSGGWGFWFGDEGGAFWIGRAALQAVSHHTDGRGPATILEQAVLHHLEIKDPREILATLSSAGDVRLAIAELCTLVTTAAQQEDAVATSILHAAAKQLAMLIESTATRLSLHLAFPLALAGGVVCGSELLRSLLQKEMQKRNLQPDPIQLVPHPVLGCVRIAKRLLSDQ